jgi:hypothetical protein
MTTRKPVSFLGFDSSDAADSAGAAKSTPLVVTLAAGGSALVGAAALYVHKFTKRVYAPRAEAADAPSTLYNAIASP